MHSYFYAVDGSGNNNNKVEPLELTLEKERDMFVGCAVAFSNTHIFYVVNLFYSRATIVLYVVYVFFSLPPFPLAMHLPENFLRFKWNTGKIYACAFLYQIILMMMMSESVCVCMCAPCSSFPTTSVPLGCIYIVYFFIVLWIGKCSTTFGAEEWWKEWKWHNS